MGKMNPRFIQYLASEHIAALIAEADSSHQRFADRFAETSTPSATATTWPALAESRGQPRLALHREMQAKAPPQLLVLGRHRGALVRVGARK